MCSQNYLSAMLSAREGLGSVSNLTDSDVTTLHMLRILIPFNFDVEYKVSIKKKIHGDFKFAFMNDIYALPCTFRMHQTCPKYPQSGRCKYNGSLVIHHG